MSSEVLIVADDLTGALDVAGPFASRGHATVVAVDPHACATDGFGLAQVLSINVTSRHLEAQHAAALVRDTVRRVCPNPLAIVIKKIDSTLRGNVAAETLALMEATGRRVAVVAPAFPAQGRTVIESVVHVHGTPLPDTAFASDALSPPPLEPLDVVFRLAAPQAIVTRVPPQGPFDFSASTRHIYVVDTRSDADLDATVRALQGRFAQCVLVGSAGIAGAVARNCLPAEAAMARLQVDGDIAVVVGSRAEASAQQVEALRMREDVAVAQLPNGEGSLAALLTSRAHVLVLKAVAGDRPGEAQSVASALAENTLALLRSRPVAAVVATGGDTAIAILHALRCAHLRVLGDVMPGIPSSELEVAGRKVALLTKAGGFGNADTFVELVRRLRS